MSIPRDEEELKKFREDLDKLDIQVIKENLRHQTYGTKDSWRTKEAEARVKKEEDASEYKIKQESLLLQSVGNKIAQQANTVARMALCISVVALILSILIVIFK